MSPFLSKISAFFGFDNLCNFLEKMPSFFYQINYKIVDEGPKSLKSKTISKKSRFEVGIIDLIVKIENLNIRSLQ